MWLQRQTLEWHQLQAQEHQGWLATTKSWEETRKESTKGPREA